MPHLKELDNSGLDKLDRVVENALGIAAGGGETALARVAAEAREEQHAECVEEELDVHVEQGSRARHECH